VDCEALASGTFVGDIDALMAQRQADSSLDHETPIEELFEDQLACADLVLLTKVDRVDDETRHKVQTWLQQELRPSVKIVPCKGGEINPDVLLGFNAAVEDNLESRPSHHDTEEEHDHDDDITSTYFIADRQFEPEDLVKKLQSLMQSQEIYRIKGFVAVPKKPMRMVLQGVGDRIEYFYDRPWEPSEMRQTKLVFIGRELERDRIAAIIGN